MYQLRSGKPVRGFTLTEVAIVLGVMGLILGAIWVAAASVYKNLRISRASEQLLQIAQNVRTMHASQNTVGVVAQNQWIASGVIPRDLISGTTTSNVWGGTVTINATTVNGLAGDGFAVTFGQIPVDACVEFITRNTGEGRDSGLIDIGVAANNNFAQGTFSVAGGTIPVGLAAALGACGNTQNAVTFNFRLKG